MKGTIGGRPRGGGLLSSLQDRLILQKIEFIGNTSAYSFLNRIESTYFLINNPALVSVVITENRAGFTEGK